MYRNCVEHPGIFACMINGYPTERIELGTCACGDTVYADEDFVYINGEIMHDECAEEFLKTEFDDLSLKEKASALGVSLAW